MMGYVHGIMARLQVYRTAVDGATSIEYGLIATGISLSIAGIVFTFGDTLKTMFFDNLPGMWTP